MGALGAIICLEMSEFIGLLESVWGGLLHIFSNQAFTNVFSALLGALFGSISGYWFNRKLEKNRMNERYLIQRKNTIYSPVYKRLLALRRYLQYIDGRENKSTDIKLKEDRYSDSRSFDFHIWKDINEDIRKVYISAQQRDAMNILIDAIKGHALLETRVDKKITRIRDNFLEKNKDKLKSSAQPAKPYQTYQPNGSYIIVSALKWYIYPTGDSDDKSTRAALTKGLFEAYTFDESEAENEANTLIAKMKKKKTQSEINTSFSVLLKATDDAVEVFESTIGDIVNKYEGGV